MKKTTWLAACMAAVCALALVTGCSSETDEPDGIEYDAGEWLIEGRTVLRYTGTGTDVHVPVGVTVIGKHAFESRTAVAHVTLPDSVAVIEDYAFYGCTNLADVKLPESVAMIGWYAFSGCESLTEVTIPAKVTAIGDYAFRGCESLETVTIHDGVKTIGQNAFSNCTDLKSVTIPASVETIGYDAFYGCNSLDTVTYQGDLAQWCALDGGDLMSYAKRVTIGGEDLQSMTELVIPDDVETIGSGAFRGCDKLTSVTIPASVKTIGSNAFSGCNSLDTVTYQGDLAQWCALDGGGNLMSSAKHVTIGDEELQSMTELVIPNGVTSIGSGAFRGCGNLTSVTISAGVKTIGDSAFYGCSGLTEVTIPEGVTEIGSQAFSSCSKLTTVAIPASVESIGYNAFNSCSNLTDVTYGGTQAQWDKIEKSSQIFYFSNNTITGKDGVTFTVDRYGNIIESE